MSEKRTYEQDITRLEEIVSRLERGEVPLEESIALFEEGTRLAAACTKRLDEAQQLVTRLASGGADGFHLEEIREEV